MNEEELRYRIGQLISISRPRFWIYLAGPVIVGAAFGAASLDSVVSVPVLILLGYFLLPANLFLYGINDRFDVDIDAYNPKKHDRERRWSGDRFTLSVVLIAGLLGVVTFVVTPPGAWPYLVGFLVLAVAYSVPPIRFKTRFGLDSLSNGLYILPGAAMYMTLTGTHPPASILIGAWLWTMGMHTFSAIPDILPDRVAGIRTTATVLGTHRTLVFCFLCWIGSALAFGVVRVGAGVLMTLYPLLVVWVWRSSTSIDRAYWWFPAINTIVGVLFTLAGFWRFSGTVTG